MTISDVFKVIEKEREYQDMNWSHLGHNPLVKQYQYAGPHILLIESYVNKARETWVKSQEEVDVLRIMAKIAAISFRSLEEIKDALGNVLKREDVTDAILTARDIQNHRQPHDKFDAEQYIFIAPHLLMVERYLGSIEASWYRGEAENVMLGLIHLTALTVRALEEVNGPNLLEIGVR